MRPLRGQSVKNARRAKLTDRRYDMDALSIAKDIILYIQNLLGSKDFIDAHRYPGHFVRKRKLSILQVIIYLFYTTKQAMHLNVSNIVIDLPELAFPKVTKQAVSKARQGILPSLFKELLDFSVEYYYKSIKTLRKWRKHYNIFAVDGSRINLPNSKSNFENYCKMFSMKNPNRQWTAALCSTIYDVCNDIIVQGFIRPFLASERQAALDHCKELEVLNLFTGSILIFDRGYFSDRMFRYFAEKGYLCVMRIKDSLNLAKQCTGDSILTLPGDPKKGTADITVRVIAVKLDSGETEYLATTLFDPAFTPDDFKELYFLRWPIESKYNELKNRFLIEEFSGATSISIEQEFYINLLLANLAAMIKASADKEIKQTENPKNKYRYQANRSFIIGKIKRLLPRIIASTTDIKSIDDVFELACINKSQIQPGRKCPRNHRAKYRERNHFNNRKTAV